MKNNRAVKKLKACALVAGAMAAIPATASASIVTTPGNFEISDNGFGYSLADFGGPNIGIASTSRTGDNETIDYLTATNPLVGVELAEVPIAGFDIPPGTTLGPSTTFFNAFLAGGVNLVKVTVEGTPPGSFPIVSPLYLGFEVASGNGYDYGFADFEPPANSTGCMGICADLAGFSIETDGGPITTPSSVPEPNSLALLAAGAVGLAALRHRRANGK